MLIGFLIDIIFWGFLDKRREMLIAATEGQSNADLNDEIA